MSDRDSTVPAPVAGQVWKLQVQLGDQVQVGDVVAVLESMKLEFPIEAETSGRVAEVLVKEGDAVAEGQLLVRLA